MCGVLCSGVASALITFDKREKECAVKVAQPALRSRLYRNCFEIFNTNSNCMMQKCI